jgi:hypothetical protein
MYIKRASNIIAITIIIADNMVSCVPDRMNVSNPIIAEMVKKCFVNISSKLNLGFFNSSASIDLPLINCTTLQVSIAGVQPVKPLTGWSMGPNPAEPTNLT